MGRAEELMFRLGDGNGLAYIDTLIAEAKHEELFLDFKQSGDGGRGKSLHESDIKNLRKALSGFANSEGGLILWGVGSDRRSGSDVPTKEPALENCRRFAGMIDAAVSGGTVPPVPGVRSIAIPRDGGPSGYVATLIPASPNAPHQSRHEDRYYIRAGSDFVPASHGIIAGLFGRQPRPSVGVCFLLHPADPVITNGRRQIKAYVGLMLMNDGSVVASDVYVAWRIAQMGGAATSLVAFDRTGQRFQMDRLHPRIGCCLATQGNRLAPGAHQVPVELRFILEEPFTEGISFEIKSGCASAPPSIINCEVSADDVSHLFEEAHRLHGQEKRQSRGQVPTDWHEWSRKLLGIKTDGQNAPSESRKIAAPPRMRADGSPWAA